ncbi:toprim domain-containing protein [Emticicia sp. SJ17W-69]|uniref:toprim domain-containing protein n=1 Tax=Emticicia sp. SJ17W-69 TaxID=3421657 RepID=UPI003EBA781C
MDVDNVNNVANNKTIFFSIQPNKEKEMVNQDKIQALKQISIVAYLETKCITYHSKRGNTLLFSSPFRDDSTPSFYVYLNDNKYHDFGSGESGGDIIQLATKFNNGSFTKAITELENMNLGITPAFSFAGQTKSISHSIVEIIEEKPLQHNALLNYLQSRSIDVSLGRLYLKEVIYEVKGKRWFGIGFMNDSGGYEIRNSINGIDIKTSTKPKTIRTIEISGSKSVNVFEGFFDFLSALSYFQLSKPNYSTIILNTLSLLPKAITTLSVFQRVNCFFDNDEAGKKAFHKCKEADLNVFDRSVIYSDFKDFNEFYCKRTKSCEIK